MSQRHEIVLRSGLAPEVTRAAEGVTSRIEMEFKNRAPQSRYSTCVGETKELMRVENVGRDTRRELVDLWGWRDKMGVERRELSRKLETRSRFTRLASALH